MDLEGILKDLSLYHRNKNDLKILYINERLNKSLETYYKELSSSLDYLSNRNQENLAKKVRNMKWKTLLMI